MATPDSNTASLVSRQLSMHSAMSEDAVPTEDPKNTVELLFERLTAWKHVVDTVEDYLITTERVQRAQAKEYQKVLKTLQSPMKAGHHFDQKIGGIASLFENMRQNTQGLINSYLETEKNIKATVIPVIELLRKEIKIHSKEFTSMAIKGAKDVEKARNLTQKHIELLGQNVAGFDSSGSRLHSTEDPYVLQRTVLHYLHKQILEENAQRQVLVSLQRSFYQFEQRIIEGLQTSLSSLTHSINTQAQSQQEHYSDIVKTVQAIPLDFEWNGFVNRSTDMIVNPTIPDRTIDTLKFPNQDHKSTKPVIEGVLERKSRNKLSFAGFTTGYYVVTLSKFLHEFKDEDYIHKDPEPELSIYLPEATIGLTSGERFNLKGRDVSKGLSSMLSGNSELHFKAVSPEEAQKWVKALHSVIGINNLTTNDPVEDTVGDEEKNNSNLPIYSEKTTVVVPEKTTIVSIQPHEPGTDTQTSPSAEKKEDSSSDSVVDKVAKAEE